MKLALKLHYMGRVELLNSTIDSIKDYIYRIIYNAEADFFNIFMQPQQNE